MPALIDGALSERLVEGASTLVERGDGARLQDCSDACKGVAVVKDGFEQGGKAFDQAFCLGKADDFYAKKGFVHDVDFVYYCLYIKSAMGLGAGNADLVGGKAAVFPTSLFLFQPFREYLQHLSFRKLFPAYLNRVPALQDDDAVYQETPPRTWGRPVQFGRALQDPRNTPTHMGKTGHRSRRTDKV